MPGDAQRRYRFGPYELRPREAVLLRDGERVDVQPQTLAALSFFVERAGQLVTRAELYAHLWPDTFVNDEALTQVVRKLRLALDDDAREPRYLQTVLKRGHRFIATVEMVREAPARAAPGSAPAPVVPVARRGRRAWWALAAAALLIAGLAAILAGRATPRRGSGGSGRLERVRLTATPEREQEAVFSPDGKSYAYAAYDSAAAQFDLYLSSFAGGNRVRLTQTSTSEAYPQFSPGGDSIAFTRFDAEGASAVHAISPLGGNDRLLVADARWGVYSPDGREIAFVRRRASEHVLLRHDLASGEEREVTRFPWIASPAWAPDGRRLAFTDERAVWQVEARGGTPRQVGEAPDSVRSLVWDSSGEAILCDASWSRDGTHDIWRLPLDGGAPEPFAAIGGAFHPAIRDGRVLLTVEHKIRQLWRVDAHAGAPAPIAVSTTVECLDVEPGGGWLALGDWSPRPGEPALAIFDLATLESRPVAEGTCAAIAADGRQIAYFGIDPPGLWSFDLDTGARRRLVEATEPTGFVEPNLYRKPAWAPDGRHLVYPSIQPEAALHRVAVDGSGLRRLASGTFGPPAYSPDGRFVAALGRRESGGAGVHVVDVENGRLESFGPPWGYARAAPVWAADGRSLRVLVDEAIDPALRHFDLDGREISPRMPLARVPDPAFWGIFDLDVTPDGGYIYLLERYEGDLYLLEPRP